MVYNNIESPLSDYKLERLPYGISPGFVCENTPSGVIAYGKSIYFSHFFHSLFLKIQFLFHCNPFFLSSFGQSLFFSFSFRYPFLILQFCFVKSFFPSLVIACMFALLVFIHSNIDIILIHSLIFPSLSHTLQPIFSCFLNDLSFFVAFSHIFHIFLVVMFFPSRILLSFSFRSF